MLDSNDPAIGAIKTQVTHDEEMTQMISDLLGSDREVWIPAK